MRTVVEVTAELTASVVRVVAAVGSLVAEDDTLLVVETMKMEIPIPAPVSGRVEALQVGPGDIVAEGDVLAVVTADG